MIAIRISGTFVPPMLSENTSLGFGHGTVVEIRTCMYETRKHEKMNVSLSRKIHIIALPHGTAKACLSAEKSVTTPPRPAGHRGRLHGTRHAIDSHRRQHPSGQVIRSRPNRTSQTTSR